MRLKAEALGRALEGLKDPLDWSPLVVPFLQIGAQLPVEFRDFDHVLARAQTLLQGKTIDDIRGLIKMSNRILRAARDTKKNIEENDAETLKIIDRLDDLSQVRLLILHYKEQKFPHEILAAHALLSLYEAVHGGHTRQIRAMTTKRRSVFSEREAEALVHGERGVVAREICDALEAVAFAEGALSASQIGRKGAVAREEETYAPIRQAAIDLLINTPTLHNLGAIEAGKKIHSLLKLGSTPTAGTVGRWIRPTLSTIKKQERSKREDATCRLLSKRH